MICHEASTETSTEHVIHGIPRNWDQSRQKYGYTPSWLTRASAAACAEASVSALHPLKTTLHTAAARILLQSEFYPIGPMMNPSLTESQIMIFRVLQSSSWPVPVASLSHPFPFPSLSTHSVPVTLGLSAAQSHGHVFGSLCSRPPYHRAFPWPLLASFIPIILFLHNTHHDLT